MIAASLCVGLDDGLARTPPMGYRSWNDVHGVVNASYIKRMVDAIVSRDRTVDGVPTSLADLGYDRVGLDDGWQACGTGFSPPGKKPSFHKKDGTPLVNQSIFPGGFASMVSYGHNKKVKMDMYLLNCICLDEYTLQADPAFANRSYAGDVKMLLASGFDGVKIDNCGDDRGAGYVARFGHIQQSAPRKLIIENSNQGFGNPWPTGKPSRNPPGPPRENPPNRSVLADYCPFHMFRSGGDIGPDWGNIYGKLQYVRPYLTLNKPVSRPGCWAFPDMLEVGNFVGPHNLTESRTHFGAWCIVSSPLYLSTALADKARMDAIWPIISNREAIAVNQMWHGHPGRLVAEGTSDGSHYQVWAKAAAEGAEAVLLLNAGDKPINVTLSLATFGLPAAKPCAVRDIWKRADLPDVVGTWTVTGLASHDSAFVMFTPLPAGVLPPTNPPWPPTYNMAKSTLSMQCNSSGWSNAQRGAAFGIVSYDWSNAKAQWAKARPMDCEERLLHQAKMTKAVNASSRVFVYRNIVKALPWFKAVREKLDDPAYAGWFLKFDPKATTHVPRCAAENRSKCSAFYHDQEQTPAVPTPAKPHPDGACAGGVCDCGKVPCGEYLFDHRNGSSLRDWIVSELVLGKSALGSDAVDGLFIDDFWCSNKLCAADPSIAGCPCGDPVQGPTEIDKHSQADMGLSDEDIQQLTLGWNATMGEVQRAILKAGGYTWSLMQGQQNANAMPKLLKRSTCKARLREACAHGSSWQSHSRLFGLTIENGTQFAQLEQDIAFFLIARGPYAWIGWGTWGMTWPFNPEPAHGALPPLPHGVPRPAQLDTDYGEPLGLCREVSAGIFEREWSKAGKVRLDCEAFEATIERRADLLETALRIATHLNATADCHNGKCEWKMNSTDSAPANYPYLANSLYYGLAASRSSSSRIGQRKMPHGLRLQIPPWPLSTPIKRLATSGPMSASTMVSPVRPLRAAGARGLRVPGRSTPARRPRAFGATISSQSSHALWNNTDIATRVRHGPLPAVGGTPRRLRLKRPSCERPPKTRAAGCSPAPSPLQAWVTAGRPRGPDTDGSHDDDPSMFPPFVAAPRASPTFSSNSRQRPPSSRR